MLMDSDGIDRMRRVLRHRLLNIVSGVKSANSLLATSLDDRLEPREKEYFPLIQKECDTVVVIVERMESLLGILPDPGRTAVNDAVYNIMATFSRACPMAEVVLDVKLSEPDRSSYSSVLKVFFDEAVSNAYELSRKPVQVYVTETPEGHLIEVVDQGDALPDDTRKSMFDPFFTTRTRHLGLGLAIANRMVTELGGSLSAESGPEGNTVKCLLPYPESFDQESNA